MEFNGRISVFGGRNITPEVYENSVEIGRLLAQEEFLVFCGGGKGVMEAISKELEEGNDYLTIPIATGMDIARNAVLAYNCDAAIAISGQYGTMSEIAYAFQLDKPVIGYQTWDINPVIQAESPEDVISKLKKELNHV